MTARHLDRHDLLRRLGSALADIDQTLDASILDGAMPGPLHDTPASETLWDEMVDMMHSGGDDLRVARQIWMIWNESFDLPCRFALPPLIKGQLDSGQPADVCFGPHHILDLDPDMPRYIHEQGIDAIGHVISADDCEYDEAVLITKNAEPALAAIDRRNRAAYRYQDAEYATVLACVEAGMMPRTTGHDKDPRRCPVRMIAVTVADSDAAAS